MVKAARTEGARLALHTGDMVVDANKEEAWASWFDVEKELLASTAFAATVGNHEITDRGVQRYGGPALSWPPGWTDGWAHHGYVRAFRRASDRASETEG